MSPGDRDEGTPQSTAAEFTTTHWSVVLAERQNSSPASQAALEQLCRRYWYPLYAYVRRRGYGRERQRDPFSGVSSKRLNLPNISMPHQTRANNVN